MSLFADFDPLAGEGHDAAIAAAAPPAQSARKKLAAKKKTAASTTAPASSRRKKAPIVQSSSEETESSTETETEEEGQLPPPKPKKKKKKPIQQTDILGGEVKENGGDAEPAPALVRRAIAPKKKKKAAAPPPVDDDEEDDSEDEDEEEVEQPPRRRSPVKKNKSPPPPQQTVVTPAPASAPVPTATKAPVKKKKRPVVISSSSSDTSSTSSDSSETDDESRPPRVKRNPTDGVTARKSAPTDTHADATSAMKARKKGRASSSSTQLRPRAMPPQAQLFEFDDGSKPPPPQQQQRRSRRQVEEEEDESEEGEDESSSLSSSEEEEPEPVPVVKKKKKKTADSAAASAPSTSAAYANSVSSSSIAPSSRACSIPECGQARVKRGYCATHAVDPHAPVAATSMSAFLGDDTEEALEGFEGLQVQPKPKGKKKKTPPPPAAHTTAASSPPLQQQQQPYPQQQQPRRGGAAAATQLSPRQHQRQYADPGLDVYDEGQAAPGTYDYVDAYEIDPHADPSPPGQSSARPFVPQMYPMGDMGVGGPSDSSVGVRPKSAKDWRIDFENTSTSLGMNKNVISWNFVWKRQVHLVELHHSTFGGKRKLIVDGRIRVQEKKPFADQSRYDLRIGDGPLSCGVSVQIKAAGLTAFTYELYIERMPWDQAQKYWLTHKEV